MLLVVLLTILVKIGDRFLLLKRVIMGAETVSENFRPVPPTVFELCIASGNFGMYKDIIICEPLFLIYKGDRSRYKNHASFESPQHKHFIGTNKFPKF